MIRENTGPTKVPLTEPIFSSKIIRFFFSFNRKMLSGYCVENSQSF